MSEELAYLGAGEALARFRDRSLSPVELMTAVIARAERVEPRIGAFTEARFEQALDQARLAEARYAKPSRAPRPLEGLPLAVKDESSIAGQRTTEGSLLLRDQVATTTSPSVERLLRAGAIVHARTATPEFSCATVTHSRLWGVTRNPWNLAFSPGGSSGGSAAALAAGTTTLATGSDIAGSIRIPASCCGVVGFKPPYGRVPQEPPYNLDPYSQEGPLARSVADCALVQNVLAGPHPRDIATVRPRLRIPDDLGGGEHFRVAFSPDLGYFPVAPDVECNTRAVLDRFRDLGCAVEEVDLGWTAEAFDAAMAHLGHLFGTDVGRHVAAHGDDMTDYAKAFAATGARVTTAEFLEASNVAGRMYASLAPILERCDVLVCPTTAVASVAADHDPAGPPLRIGDSEVEANVGWVMTYPFNMLGRCPVLSVPSGFDRHGVPTGVQIVARSYDDVRVFRAAAALESAQRGLPEFARRPSL